VLYTSPERRCPIVLHLCLRMSGFSAGRSGTKGEQDEKGGAGRGGDSASRTKLRPLIQVCTV
jgi:hypothetical protein